MTNRDNESTKTLYLLCRASNDYTPLPAAVAMQVDETFAQLVRRLATICAREGLAQVEVEYATDALLMATGEDEPRLDSERLVVSRDFWWIEGTEHYNDAQYFTGLAPHDLPEIIVRDHSGKRHWYGTEASGADPETFARVFELEAGEVEPAETNDRGRAMADMVGASEAGGLYGL